MGSGAWNSASYASYSTSVGRSVKTDGTLDMGRFHRVQDVYRQSHINEELSPVQVMRECCNSDEHPNTKPVILGIDVTGSMGSTAMEVAKVLNPLMTTLYEAIPDVEFAIMGIGDLDYDTSPIQISQFESDVRVAKHLDKLWFEGGGGGNSFESYTTAWYMGSRHCKLDCWKQGRKGVIITIGDEPLNPYLPLKELAKATGDTFQTKKDIETKELYDEVSEKFEVFHVHVRHGYASEGTTDYVRESFCSVLPASHVVDCTLDELKDMLAGIINGAFISQGGSMDSEPIEVEGSEGFISW